jgi:hypothetical protein
MELLTFAILQSFLNSHACVGVVWDRELKDATSGCFTRLKEIEHVSHRAPELMLFGKVQRGSPMRPVPLTLLHPLLLRHLINFLKTLRVSRIFRSLLPLMH